MGNKVIVGISDGKVVKDKDILISYALGSCVAVCLYDKVNKIAGMVHILLPKRQSVNKGQNIFKYADCAVPTLLEEMLNTGASRAFIQAKIAGGAEMFQNYESQTGIGQMNIIAVKKILERLQIPLIAEDVGANYGRTVTFFAENGTLEVRTILYGCKEI